MTHAARKLLTSGALLCAAAGSLTAPAMSTAAPPKACKSVRDVVPTGTEDIPATRIRAVKVSCSKARKLPEKVVLNARYGSINPDEYGERAFGIVGWNCALGGYGEKTTCRRGRQRVSWFLG